MLAACLLALPLTAKTKTLSEKDMGAEAKQQEQYWSEQQKQKKTIRSGELWPDGTYWMITSGCTGWAPNEARMFSAPSIWGPWTQHPNPCRGPKADKTFEGQSTFVLPVGNQYIFMADIWRPKHPIDARYIWLPIEFEDGKPVIRWRDEWTLETK